MLNRQRQTDQGPESSSGQGKVLSPRALSLPKGGGAIRSIGEKFAANPVTGTASLSIPIATNRGRSGFGPQLFLSYDSGSGNGPLGFGWSLSLPSFIRETDKGVPASCSHPIMIGAVNPVCQPTMCGNLHFDRFLPIGGAKLPTDRRFRHDCPSIQVSLVRECHKAAGLIATTSLTCRPRRVSCSSSESSPQSFRKEWRRS